MSAYLLAVALGHPDAQQYAWQLHAKCRGTNPEQWFPGQGNPIHKLRTICHQCPVTAACLQWALETNQPGVAGGLSQRERNRLRKGTQPHELLPCRIPGCERYVGHNGGNGCCPAHNARIRRTGDAHPDIPFTRGGTKMKREAHG